ncbi:S9 family peptidase [Maribacter sp. PR1]|uniref:S9 family peptidase n=1 Tax=Maribacter cobaltidurans TaxID=1178778 RepID=A0ABU7IS68_9FLAO|nr:MULTISPECIES: S9 family peptidase [Maribacter]MDC6388427.1 S9 family peptidase [Maribacter sp. PR1]MEE1975816.1 S9 family peptidase [Maribacter cobaltidurans]
MKRLLVIPVFLLIVCSSQSQEQLKLEDIYSNGTYSSKRYGPVRWMKDNKGYSTLERNLDVGGSDIVRYEAKSGARSVLVSAEKLVPSGATEPLSIRNYEWSLDNSKLLVFTNTRKVRRYHTRGDYWVLDMASGALTQLGRSVERTTMMFAKFSPDATKVGYVSKNNIFVEDLESSVITQITFDGNDTIINGTFDWVYEEELSCRDGFRWSPNGEQIAYWQSNTENIGTFYMINNVDSIYSKPIPLPYPKVGTKNSEVKVGVVNSTGGETSWFDIPGDPTNNYLARMDFIPNSHEVMIQQLNRRQNSNTVWIGNTKTMELNTIFVDRDDAWLDVHDNIMWLENENYFTWTSEKDGALHLYKVSRDGKKFSTITKGDIDVVKINCIDPKGGYVYYIASPENYTQRYLYRSKIDGSTMPERVSPKNQPGQHGYQISADAKYAIHTYQNTKTPPVISLINLQKHSPLRVLEDNKELASKMNSLGLTPKQFIKIDIGEVVLDAWMIKPPKFNSEKKYPIVFYVYGEPAGSTVQDAWQGGDLWHQYLAAQGYIVVSIDNRGTRTPRGRDWRKSIYKQIGILAAHDQVAAAKKLFETYSFIDTGKVGIWGWSGGGQMTMNCLFRYPEVYGSGLAVAFVADQRLYDNIYQERYMGLLEDNEANYIAGSPITHAKKLKGNLMIIHGTADDNVHYQSFERLTNELIKYNKMFDMMSYPMRSHSINERENTSLHLRRTMARYWNRVFDR